ncbi:nuclear pore complex protein NUP205 [Gossypium australe]|uniref:Nuclear pore complex protein NUP205 n=1 Tax=Gossypium australe TaxID=47621 RepID=A0A5B6UME2_9ROSI|nr:nuclear pore complex protein NUP205 [Gossypium australe]
MSEDISKDGNRNCSHYQSLPPLIGDEYNLNIGVETNFMLSVENTKRSGQHLNKLHFMCHIPGVKTGQAVLHNYFVWFPSNTENSKRDHFYVFNNYL